MRVYIAGPYVPKECTLHNASRVAQQNVDKAIDAFHKLKAEGHEPFVPHLSYYIHLRGTSDYADWWYEYHLTFLEHWAEAVYMLDGWETSRGSKLEIKKAKELGLPIFYQSSKSGENDIKEK